MRPGSPKDRPTRSPQRALRFGRAVRARKRAEGGQGCDPGLQATGTADHSRVIDGAGAADAGTRAIRHGGMHNVLRLHPAPTTR
jgi:hypothetical protein